MNYAVRLKYPYWSDLCFWKQRDKHSLPCVDKPDEIIAQGSEAYLDKSGGGCPPATNYPNQFSVNNVLVPHRTPIGLTKNNYLSNQYSFAGNSGNLSWIFMSFI